MLARHEADVVCMAEMSATVTQLQTDLGTSQQEAANLMVSSKVWVLLHLCVVIFFSAPLGAWVVCCLHFENKTVGFTAHVP